MFTNEQLIGPDFDVDAYLRFVLHASGSSATAERARLATCMGEVKGQIHAILSEHSDRMVEQVRATHKAQRDVAGVSQSVRSLAKATTRLRLMIESPYSSIRDRIAELESTKAAATILRDVQRLLSLTARLQDPAVAADLMRWARTLREVDELLNTSDIRDVTVVESNKATVEKASTVLRGKIHTLLGMQELLRGDSSKDGVGLGAVPGFSKTVVDVSTALQCAHTLGNLSRVVQTVMTEHKREAMKAIMRELDTQAIMERAGTLSTGTSTSAAASGGGSSLLQATREALLMHIQSALQSTLQHTQCVLLLWWVLLGRRDPVTHAPLLAVVDAPMHLLSDYWGSVSDKLRERLVAVQKSSNLQAVLANAYPHYHSLLQSFLRSGGSLWAGATGVSGGGGGGGAEDGGFAAMTVLNVRQCGMGDYMDLMQLVEREVASQGEYGFGSAAYLSARVSAAPYGTGNHLDAQRPEDGWLAEVSEALRQRFSGQMMDRHRERCSAVLAKLASVTPISSTLGSQSANVGPLELRSTGRTPVPAHASVLDVSLYTKMALQDAHLYRHDLHAMEIVLDCVRQCVRQLHGKIRESLSKYPLPPLPSVAAAVTRTQLLHACVANGCSTLVQDLNSILAIVPQLAAPGGGQVTGQRMDTLRGQLWEFIQALDGMSEASSGPFLDSALMTLQPTITQCVEGSVAAASGAATNSQRATVESAAVGQLQAQLRHFLSHFYFLFSPTITGWQARSRRTADALVVRLLVQVAAAGGPTASGSAAVMRRCLSEVSAIVFQFVHATSASGIGRSTLILKGSTKQVEDYYRIADHAASTESPQHGQQQQHTAQELASALRPLYLPLAHLLLLQQAALDAAQHLPGVTIRIPAAEMQVQPQTFVEVLEAGVLHFCETPKLPLTSGQSDSVNRLPEAQKAIQMCFDEAIKGVESTSVFLAAWRCLSQQQQQQSGSHH